MSTVVHYSTIDVLKCQLSPVLMSVEHLGAQRELGRSSTESRHFAAENFPEGVGRVVRRLVLVICSVQMMQLKLVDELLKGAHRRRDRAVDAVSRSWDYHRYVAVDAGPMGGPTSSVHPGVVSNNSQVGSYNKQVI